MFCLTAATLSSRTCGECSRTLVIGYYLYCRLSEDAEITEYQTQIARCLHTYPAACTASCPVILQYFFQSSVSMSLSTASCQRRVLLSQPAFGADTVEVVGDVFGTEEVCASTVVDCVPAVGVTAKDPSVLLAGVSSAALLAP